MNPLPVESQETQPKPLVLYKFPQRIAVEKRPPPKISTLKPKHIQVLKAWAASELEPKAYSLSINIKLSTFYHRLYRICNYAKIEGTSKTSITRFLIREGHMTIMEFLENNPGKMLIV